MASLEPNRLTFHEVVREQNRRLVAQGGVPFRTKEEDITDLLPLDDDPTPTLERATPDSDSASTPQADAQKSRPDPNVHPIAPYNFAKSRADEVSQEGRIPFGPLRAIDPKKLSSRRDLIKQLAPSIPLNEYGLPVFIYRPDLLDHASFLRLADPAVPQAAITDMLGILTNAAFPIDYSEGYPTFGYGSPIWEQFPFEPDDGFLAFALYLGQKGARRILYPNSPHPQELTYEWFHVNSWAVRAKAFDMYRLAHHKKT